jgi:hypothetical protein
VPLWTLEFFPGRRRGPARVRATPCVRTRSEITLETDLGWSFDTDIQFGSWVFRPRSPKQPGMMMWCQARGLEPGDSIVFERLAERRFALRLEKTGG